MTPAQRLRRVFLAVLVGAVALSTIGISAATAKPTLEELERRAAAAAARAERLDSEGDSLAVRVAHLDELRAEAEAKVDALK
ncbi:MAG: hypothetical protein ACRDI3_00675, partial [Actinomycetota bacterium]